MSSQAGGRAIATLPISHNLKTALANKRYRTVADLAGLAADELVADVAITVAEAESILQAITEPPRPTQPSSQTAAALLTQSSSSRPFSTLSSAVDTLVGSLDSCPRAPAAPSLKGKERAWGERRGGCLGLGSVIEIAGPPGAGKTSMAMGLVMSARMGDDGDGTDAEVLVIDTEGAITPSKLWDAAASLTHACDVTPDDVLAGIHLVRVATQAQMIAFLDLLEEWLDEHPKVKLVIVDTLSYHFRQPSLDMGARKRIMENVKLQTGKAVQAQQRTVVIVNQLATKMLTAENKPARFETTDRAVLMPQLGDVWTTERTIRMLLFRGGPGDDLRYAHASVGAHCDTPWACFDIDLDGLPCDVPPVPEPDIV